MLKRGGNVLAPRPGDALDRTADRDEPQPLTIAWFASIVEAERRRVRIQRAALFCALIGAGITATIGGVVGIWSALPIGVLVALPSSVFLFALAYLMVATPREAESVLKLIREYRASVPDADQRIDQAEGSTERDDD